MGVFVPRIEREGGDGGIERKEGGMGGGKDGEEKEKKRTRGRGGE